MFSNWLTVSACLGAAGGMGLLGRGLFNPRSSLFGPVVYKGKSNNSHAVALTFDDGPHPEGTPAILDILDKHQVCATFFVIGRHVQQYPDLVKKIDRQGHRVANHSYHHSHIGMFYGYRYWFNQITRTNQLIEDTIHRKPAYFRPPMGFKQLHMAKAARRSGCTMVTWSKRAWDTRQIKTDQIVTRLTKNIEPGDIIMLHDGIDPYSKSHPIASVSALGPLISKLKSSGISIIKLDELISLKAYQ